MQICLEQVEYTLYPWYGQRVNDFNVTLCTNLVDQCYHVGLMKDISKKVFLAKNSQSMEWFFIDEMAGPASSS